METLGRVRTPGYELHKGREATPSVPAHVGSDPEVPVGTDDTEQNTTLGTFLRYKTQM